MAEIHALELTGAPGSPYTRKMIAALRYRRLPYTVYWGATHIPEGYPEPAVKLLPTFYFPDGADGKRIPVTDSTPILRRLETEYAGRALVPSDPVLRFLNDLIEDYADEWLTKAMFHFRWAHEADWKNAAPLLVYWNTNTVDRDAAAKVADVFARRQIDRLYVVGSNPVTAETIEQSYRRLIAVLDALIGHKGFILGARPSAADFAVFGQLSQLAVVEPTSAEITRNTSQRVRAWVDLMEDLSGLEPQESDWLDAATAHAVLAPLLAEIGRTYAPAMIANAEAIQRGEKTFSTEIDSRPWTQPVFKYQAKCLDWLRADYDRLSETARHDVDALLAGSGCETLFRLRGQG